MKMLFIAICISLIVFAGAVPPAYKSHLDTVYGRFLGVIAVLFVTEIGGWPLGILTAMVFLILMPATVSEGFDASGIVTNNTRSVLEGFIIEDKKSTTDRNRWFIERIQGEIPKEIDMDNVLSPPIY